MAEKEKIEEPKAETKKVEKPVYSSGEVWVFKSNGKHDGKQFKKGQKVECSSALLEKFKSNGIVVSEAEFKELQKKPKRTFRNDL